MICDIVLLSIRCGTVRNRYRPDAGAVLGGARRRFRHGRCVNVEEKILGVRRDVWFQQKHREPGSLRAGWEEGGELGGAKQKMR